MWDDEIDFILLSLLQVAYMRRRQWEARLQANEILRALNDALSARDRGGNGRSSPSPVRRVSAEQLMITMGAKWH